MAIKMVITTVSEGTGNLSCGSECEVTEIIYLDLKLGRLDRMGTWMAKIKNAVEGDLVMSSARTKCASCASGGVGRSGR